MKHFFLVLSLLSITTFQLIESQVFPAEKWQTEVNPAFHGWSMEDLGAMEEYVVDSTQITGILVVHEGKVIYEYGNISENSYIASCRKSILAMLYGKYVSDGTISLDKNLRELQLDKYESLLESELTATTRDVISSRSGVFQPASNRGDMSDMAPERGSVRPGEFWLYSNWDFNVAGHIFEQETGRNIYDEIESQFAKPLSMQDWDRSLQEKSGDQTVSDIMAYHMWFSARDMARLGLLMLNNGKWNDQQIIESDWVIEMTSPKTTAQEVDKTAAFINADGARYGYGYMWWLWDKPENEMLKGAYSALGAWGQNLTVFPEMNTVLSIKTNDRYERRRGNHNVIVDYISKAYNPESDKQLEELANALQGGDLKTFFKKFQETDTQLLPANYEGLLNGMGYRALYGGDLETALQIFHFNVDQNPAAWNPYDSLGEAYFMIGDWAQAKKYYTKTLELNTENVGGNNDRVWHILRRITRKMENSEE